MDRIYISLVLDLTDEAVEGAGWYLFTGTDQQRLWPVVSVSPEQARTIGSAIHRELGHPRQAISLPELIDSGNNLIPTALQQQLVKAEEIASRVGVLRKKLSTFGNDNASDS